MRTPADDSRCLPDIPDACAVALRWTATACIKRHNSVREQAGQFSLLLRSSLNILHLALDFQGHIQIRKGQPCYPEQPLLALAPEGPREENIHQYSQTFKTVSVRRGLMHSSMHVPKMASERRSSRHREANPRGRPARATGSATDLVPPRERPRTVLIDPRVSFGRPVVAGTGIPTAVLAE